MAMLTHPVAYNIEDSNIALLGSDLEKHVREHASDTESQWTSVRLDEPDSVHIWRIEHFHVIPWPRERYGSFYDGDSYIILHTYKVAPDSVTFSYDLHFWLGANTTQDEAGTAAYKTVELDDHLLGVPVQYREVQGHESQRFLSYFPRFVCLHGGVSSGFHHIVDRPPLNVHKLYRISSSHHALRVHEVPAEARSLVAGDTYVLDKGAHVLQFNCKTSSGVEKFKAAEFVRQIVDGREGKCELSVYDEGGPGAGIFLSQFGEGTGLRAAPERPAISGTVMLTIYRVSDASGRLLFEPADRLESADAFVVDASKSEVPMVYTWIGRDASLNERRLALQYAQNFLYAHRSDAVAVPIVRVNEGHEPNTFKALSLIRQLDSSGLV
ncbi:actin regulatory protein [Fistulina hepatica ATCC 64428]|uniref:Actin regulatory protein n=1 Tax=Fistulina hepatica ATCC 64428 TaxID=1128425 RepID=A0A0D7A6T4_9AGAR|nr:actin regulatory protein [Fistulina hepatica ATCC 64428]